MRSYVLWQEEESELEQQLRELELELAQTKLALVESECHCQELNHQLARNAQDKEKAQGTPWLSKTIQGIIKKQNSQVDSSWAGKNWKKIKEYIFNGRVSLCQRCIVQLIDRQNNYISSKTVVIYNDPLLASVPFLNPFR